MRSRANRDLAVAAILILLAACGMGQNPSPPAARSETAAPPTPRVILPDGYAVEVEIAADDETRAQGLMYRDRLAENRGMLFFFRQNGEYPFWMKNTFIPLDIIWIDEHLRVAHVKAGVPPCQADPCPSYAPGVTSKYVLELASGTAGRHAVVPGALLRFEGVEKITAH
ncbi:MAG TPA: DUF192 domain-containing protein [Thermoanaerobaculia bacterium]|nr:DUF192 domain-containing protein [Thermoanaerobaculia bacterium]